MGKQGGRQKPAGEEKGWREGGHRGPGMASPALHSQVSRAELRRTPHTGQPAWPPLPLSSTSSCPLCGHPGPGTAEPSHPLGTRPPKHHLAVSEVASQARKRSRPQRTAGAAVLSPQAPCPVWALEAGHLGRTAPADHWGLQVGGGTTKQTS